VPFREGPLARVRLGAAPPPPPEHFDVMLGEAKVGIHVESEGRHTGLGTTEMGPIVYGHGPRQRCAVSLVDVVIDPGRRPAVRVAPHPRSLGREVERHVRPGSRQPDGGQVGREPDKRRYPFVCDAPPRRAPGQLVQVGQPG